MTLTSLLVNWVSGILTGAGAMALWTLYVSVTRGTKCIALFL